MITIITPFFNSMSTIDRVFNSVLNQTYDNFVWLIIDDGSDSSELKSLSKLIEVDSRIKLLFNKFSKGAGGARNTGLINCKSDYVTFIDSDDTWDTDFLEQSVKLLDSGLAGVTFGYRMLNEKKSDVGFFLPEKIVYLKSISQGCDVSCLSSAYNIGMCKYLPLFGETRARNDLYFVHNFLVQGLYITPIPIIKASYYVGKSSISSNKFKLIKYMYAYSRFSGYSVFSSFFNVFTWFFYGLKKYKKRYFGF